MARITICKFREHEITIDEALALRSTKGERGFRCVGCGQPLVAHSSGSDGQPHFEHVPKNPACQAQ